MSYKGVFIIDGTGEDKDSEYFKIMGDSFCSTLYSKLSGLPSSSTSHNLSYQEKFSYTHSSTSSPVNNINFFVKYLRGPTILGFNTEDIAYMMLKEIDLYILECQRQKVEPSIYLIGHSRGGAAVIYIAYHLNQKRHPTYPVIQAPNTPRYLEPIRKVKAMFLFDAVDRYWTSDNIDLEEVPNNVEQCYHARRDDKLVKSFKKTTEPYQKEALKRILQDVQIQPYGGFSYPYQNTQTRTIKPTSEGCSNASRTNQPLGLDCLNDIEVLSEIGHAKVTSRNEFEIFNGVSIPFGNCGIKGSQNYKEAFFLGTHGAMGGTPTALSPVAKERELAPKSLEWRNIEEQAVYDVDVWMSQYLKSEGITSTLILDKNIKKFKAKMLLQEKNMCSPTPNLTNTDILNSFLDFKPPK